jgi:hypothetical protein
VLDYRKSCRGGSTQHRAHRFIAQNWFAAIAYRDSA